VLAFAMVFVMAGWPAAAAQPSCDMPVGASTSLHALLTRIEGHVPLRPELGESDQATDLLGMMHASLPLGDELAVAQRVYGVKPPNLEGDERQIEAALQSWSRTLARQIQAHGVLLRDSRTGAIRAVAAYASSPLLERLRVVRLDPELAFAPHEAILAHLDTCFVQVDTWIEIPTHVVEALLAEHEEGYLYAAVTTLDGEEAGRWVDLRYLIDVVTFEHVSTEDAVTFSAWFAGNGVSPLRLARVLPEVRSNVTPTRLLEVVTGILR